MNGCDVCRNINIFQGLYFLEDEKPQCLPDCDSHDEEICLTCDDKGEYSCEECNGTGYTLKMSSTKERIFRGFGK
jgi:hypothetical protein